MSRSTGGIYIPPYRLQQELKKDQGSEIENEAYQKLSWEALKKSLNGLINKVNTSNIKNIVVELFSENLIRGRALFTRSLLKAQAASLPFTPVFAALVAVLNSKLPILGELVIKKLILQFRRSYRRNDKTLCLASVSFLAHLINQHVVHELLALELLTLLLERPTDDSIEISVGFLKECGATLSELSPKGMEAVFEGFRSILVDPQEPIDQRVQWMIQVLFQIRKDKFKDHISIKEELDLVDEDDRITHTISLTADELDADEGLLVFKVDPSFQKNETKYAEIKEDIIGDVDLEELANEADQEDTEALEKEMPQATEGAILDNTGTNLVVFRKTIYLTIMSSLDYEECCHKLLKMNIPQGLEPEVCNMIIECCSQEKVYSKFFGLLADKLCKVNPLWPPFFEQCFVDIYESIHRFETNRIRNISKLFAFILSSQAISWSASLRCIHLNEAETTSASRVFIKFIFTELSQELGIHALNARLNPVEPSPEWEEASRGLFPTDDLRHMRFAINFFTAIDLGPLTDRLREVYDQTQQKIQKSSVSTLKTDSKVTNSSDELGLSDISLSEDEMPQKKHRSYVAN